MQDKGDTLDTNRVHLAPLTPLFAEPSSVALRKLTEHADAPRWNHSAGDRLEGADLEWIAEFRRRLSDREPWSPGRETPSAIEAWVRARSKTVPWFRKVLPARSEISRAWCAIPTMSRETIALSPEELVPDDADLMRMVCYRTSGTTGHPLLVPHHPIAVGEYQVLIEAVLERYGVSPSFSPDTVGCILLGAQKHTVTYATTLSLWNGCGFAKINMCSDEWPRADSARKYVEAMAPLILTGDPISFAELLAMGVRLRPLAMISTAVAMSPMLKSTLTEKFRCPVIEWYSLTETGPIGYSCPRGAGYHVLPHDIYLEILDAEGNVLPPGETGEVTISGGRNPYVPLLRYRTGDWGALDFSRCACGDKMPRLIELDGRKPVIFRSKSGSIVNPVDISRVLREFPLLQHSFVQKSDYSIELSVRLIPGYGEGDLQGLEEKITRLFGKEQIIRVEIDESPPRGTAGKIPAYASQIPVEE